MSNLIPYIEQAKPSLMGYAPEKSAAEYQIELLKKVVSKLPDNINPHSLVLAAYDCISLGLTPDPAKGHAYFVPYKGQVQLIIGYQGLMHLCRRAGLEILACNVVYDCEQFEAENGTDGYIKHTPMLLRPDGAKLVGAYVIGRLASGEKVQHVMSGNDILEIKRQAKSSNVWQAHEAEMWRKTAMRRFAKYMSKDDALSRAVRIDEINASPTRITRNLDEYGEAAQQVVFEATTAQMAEWEEKMYACTTMAELAKVGATVPKNLDDDQRQALASAYQKIKEKLKQQTDEN